MTRKEVMIKAMRGQNYDTEFISHVVERVSKRLPDGFLETECQPEEEDRVVDMYKKNINQIVGAMGLQ